MGVGVGVVGVDGVTEDAAVLRLRAAMMPDGSI